MRITTGVAGFFKIEAINRQGRKRVLADWFPNLITNGGLDQIGTAAGYLLNCYVGSGNTAPANTNTALVSLVASTNTIIASAASVHPTTPYYGSRINTYRYAVGVATGVLAEIGIGASSSALFSRALVLDGGGNPTSVTVLADESLNVYYELRLYPPLADVTGSVTIASVAYAYVARAANAGAGNWAPSQQGDLGGPQHVTVFSGGIGAITAAPSGTSQIEDGGAEGAYSNGTHFNTRVSDFGAAIANFGGVNSFLVSFGQTDGAFGSMQVGLTPAIPKDSTHTLSLTAKHAWSRSS